MCPTIVICLFFYPACGIEYCVLCRDNVCLTCLAETVLYEHECIACPLAPLAIEAIEQEHEVELEEEEKQIRTIECTLTISVRNICFSCYMYAVHSNSCSPHYYYVYSYTDFDLKCAMVPFVRTIPSPHTQRHTNAHTCQRTHTQWPFLSRFYLS